jgi:parallel beta-helix repeat protein
MNPNAVKKSLAIAVILLFVGIAVAPSIHSYVTVKNIIDQQPQCSITTPLKKHTKITIQKNADFSPRNGVVGGTGTKTDPYLISGWDFNGIYWKRASDKISKILNVIDPLKRIFLFLFLFTLYTLCTPSAISIQNTDKYVVIQDNSFQNWVSNSISISNAKNVTIASNTIRGNGTGVDLRSASAIAIQGNTISSCYWAIHSSGNNIVVEENQIRNCQGGISAQGSTIHLRNNTLSSINGLCTILLLHVTGNSVIENCLIQNCSFDGGIICFNQTRNVTIRNNTLIHTRGFAAITGDSALIENNTMNDCSTGIQCFDSIIHYNVVTSCAIGIAVKGSCSIIHNNISLNAIGIGCYWPPGSHPLILNNSIYNNNEGIYCIESSTPLVLYNNIYGNQGGFIYNGGATINATYNWWGASDGPSGFGPGTGDSVSNDVDYTPWLTTPNPNAGR